MSEGEANCDYCLVFVALFLVRLLSAVYFGIMTETSMSFYTIPVAVIMMITGACMYSALDKKCAKNNGGTTYLALMVIYNGLWYGAIDQYDYVMETGGTNRCSWSSCQERRIDIQGLLMILTVNIFFDTYINRKFLRKYGAKSCASLCTT